MSTNRTKSLLILMFAFLALNVMYGGATEKIFRRGNMVLQIKPDSGDYKVYYNNKLVLLREWSKIKSTLNGKPVNYRLIPSTRFWNEKAGLKCINESENEVIVLWEGYSSDSGGSWGVSIKSDSFKLLFDLNFNSTVYNTEIAYYICDDYFKGAMLETDDGKKVKLSWDRYWPDKVFFITKYADFVTENTQMKVFYNVSGIKGIRVEDRRKKFNGYYFRLDSSRKKSLKIKGDVEFRFDRQTDAQFQVASIQDKGLPSLKTSSIAAVKELGNNLHGVQNGIPFSETKQLQGVELRPGKSIVFPEKGAFENLFILGAGDNIDAGQNALKVNIRYQDGSTNETVLNSGVDFQNIIAPLSGKNHKVSLQKYSHNGDLIGITIHKLPVDPNKKVQSIEISSLNHNIALFGVTLASKDIPLKALEVGGGGMLDSPPLHIALLPQRFRYDTTIGRLPKEMQSKSIVVKKIPYKHIYSYLSTHHPNVIIAAGDDVNSKGGHYNYPGPYPLTKEDAAIIEKAVKNGTGLFCNRDLKDVDPALDSILPVKMEGSSFVDLRKSNKLVTFTPENGSHFLLDHIRWKNFPALLYYFKATPKKGATVLAYLSNGDPAFVTWKVGKGRVLWSAIQLFHGKGDIPSYNAYENIFRDYIPFLLRLNYWLAGNNNYANIMNDLILGRKARGAMIETIANFYNKAEQVNAFVQYTRNTDIDLTFNNVLKEANNAFQIAIKGDSLQSAHNFSKSKEAYVEACSSFKKGLKTLTELEKKLKRDFDRFAEKPGDKIMIGPHHDNWLWNDKLHSKPGNVAAHRYRREQDYLRNKRLYGYNMLSIGHGLSFFLRDDCDPEVIDKNDFQFDVYDHFVDIARKHKLNLMVFALERNYGKDVTARNDRMLSTPECEPLTSKRKSGGSMLRSNIWNNEVRKRRFELLKAFSAYWGQLKDVNIIGIQRDNESGGVELRDTKTISRFQQYLKTKYKSIAKLNKTYGSSFKQFGEIQPPIYNDIRDSGSLSSVKRAVWHDWRLFVDRENLLYYKAGYDGIKAGAPHIPASARFSYNATSRGNSASCLPYDQVMKYYDISGGQHHGTEGGLDYVVGMAGKKFKNMSEYYSGNERPSGTAEYIPGFNYSMFLYSLKNELPIYHATSRWMWRNFSRGVESFQIHNSGAVRWMVTSASALSASGRGLYPRLMGVAMKNTISDFEKFNSVMKDTNPWFQGGMVTVRDSHFQIPGTYVERRRYEYNHANMVLRQSFIRHHLQIDQVPEDKDYSSYPVLIFHQAEYMSAKTAKRVLDYVKNGGTLISIGAIENYNSYSRPAGTIMHDIFKADAEVIFSKDYWLNYDDGVTKQQLRISPPGKNNAWAFNLKQGSKAKVLATWQSGKPAILEASYGKGKAYILGEDLIGSRIKYDPVNKVLFDRLLMANCPPRTLKVTEPDIHVYTRINKNGDKLFFVTNSRLAPLKDTLKFNLTGSDKDKVIVDCRAGIIVPKQIVDYTFMPGECRVYMITDKPGFWSNLFN